MNPMDSLQWSKLPDHVDFVVFVDWTRSVDVTRSCYRWLPYQLTFWDPYRYHSIVVTLNLKTILYTYMDVETNQRLNTWPMITGPVHTLDSFHLKRILGILGREHCTLATVDGADMMYLEEHFRGHTVVYFGEREVTEGVRLDWMRHRKTWSPYRVRWGEGQVMQDWATILQFATQDAWMNFRLIPNPYDVLWQEGGEKVKDFKQFMEHTFWKRLDSPLITYQKSAFHFLDELYKDKVEVVYRGKEWKKEEVMAAFQKERRDWLRRNECKGLVASYPLRRTKSLEQGIVCAFHSSFTLLGDLAVGLEGFLIMEGMSALDTLQWSQLPPHIDYIAFVDFQQEGLCTGFNACNCTLYDPHQDVVTSQDNDPCQGSLSEWSCLIDFFPWGRKCVIATVDWTDFLFLKKLLWKRHEVVFFGKEKSPKAGVLQLGWMVVDDDFYVYSLQLGEHQIVEQYDAKFSHCFSFNDIIFNRTLTPDPFVVMAQKGVENVVHLDSFLVNELKKRVEGPWVTVEQCDFHYLSIIERNMRFGGTVTTGIKVVYEGCQFSKEEVIDAFKWKRILNK